MLPVIAFSWIAAALLGAQAPRAQDMRPLGDALTLDFDGACLTAHAVSRQITRFLGRDWLDQRITIEVVGAQRPLGVAFRIRWLGQVVVDRAFPRVPDCRDLAAALGVTIALALEGSLAPTSAAPAAPSVAAPPPPPAAPPAEVAPARLAVAGVAGAGILSGVLIRPAMTASAGVEGAGDAIMARLSCFAAEAVDSAFAGGTVRTGLVAGRLDLCVGRVLGSFETLACAGIAGGVISAQGHTFDEDEIARLGWMAGAVQLALGRAISGPVSVRLFLDGLAGLWRPRVIVTGPDGGSVATRALPVLGFAAGLALKLRLP